MPDPRFCRSCGAALVPPTRPEWKVECPRCGWFRPTNAMPVVSVLARSPSGRIVHTRKRDWPPGAWGLVAGVRRGGETAEGAAVRELEQETALHGRSARLLRTIVDRDRLLIAVAVDIDEIEPRDGTDVNDVRLAAPDPALTPLDWPARQLVEDAIASRR